MKKTENASEEMAENFSSLKKETDIQVQEAQRVPNKTNLDRHTPRPIIIKMAKVRVYSKGSKRKRVSYKATPIKLTVDLSTGTLQVRREWHNIFKVLKGKNLQPDTLPSKITV